MESSWMVGGFLHIYRAEGGLPMAMKEPHAEDVPLLQTSELSDDAARVWVWADRLQAIGRVAEARQALREALDHFDDTSELMVRLALLERDHGNRTQAIDLFSKVLGERPGHKSASYYLSRILLEEDRAKEAAAIVAALPKQTHDEFGELVGEIFYAQGQYAMAVEAFGAPPSLSRRGRRLRRRSWWRCGGPFRRVGRAALPSSQVLELIAPPEPPDALLKAVTWAEWLWGEGRNHEARQVLSGAMTEYGRHPRLLRCLAGIEATEDAPETALYLWCEAYRDSPNDVDIVCGLARQLSKISLRGSEFSRFQEAVEILNAFPNQQHPKIRATRGDIFSDYPMAPSRVVQAYGTATELPFPSASNRRRCWRRSAGPLGQFLTHLTDWRRGPWPALVGHPAPRASAESEEVARLIDSLGDRSPSSARERIEEAWLHHGRLPSLLLAHAELDWQEDSDWQCLALTAEAMRADPDNSWAVCWLARCIDYLFDCGTAVEVMESLPTAAQQAVTARVVLANFYYDSGDFALAAASYGDPRDLNLYWRRYRRRSMRRGLLQRRGSSSGHDRASFDLTTFDLVGFEVAQALDKAQALQDSADHGRAVLDAAIAAHGRHPLLLLLLARAQRYAGDLAFCTTLASEVLAKPEESPLITSMAIRELWLGDFDTEALRVLIELPDKLTETPALQELAGNLLSSWDLPGHAVLAFGTTLLDSSGRRARRICWWRSGGPYGRLRRAIEAEEWTVMSDWPLPETQRTALASLSLPADLLTEVQSDLSSYRRGLLYRTRQAPEVAEEWLSRVVVPAVLGFAALALAVVEQARWPTDPLGKSLGVAVAIVAAVLGVFWIISKLRRPVMRLRTLLATMVFSAGGAWYLLQSPREWLFAIGLALATLALAIFSGYAVLTALRATAQLRDNRWQRAHSIEAVLTALLDLLDELATIRPHQDAIKRRRWMTSLEQVALAIERNFPYTLRGGDQQSRADIAAHAQGVAWALRALKRSVALPDKTSWDLVASQLKATIVTLAQGDLANLPVAQPTSAPLRQPQPWWRHAMQITRTILVILAPPLVAFLLPLVVPLSGPAVAWLRLATVVWALLASIIALDPGISEKVSQMRAILSIWREAGLSSADTGQPSPSTPAAQAAPISHTASIQRARATHARRGGRQAFRS
jgi:hypothetical protein